MCVCGAIMVITTSTEHQMDGRAKKRSGKVESVPMPNNMGNGISVITFFS